MTDSTLARFLRERLDKEEVVAPTPPGAVVLSRISGAYNADAVREDREARRRVADSNDVAALQLLALPYADHPDYRQEWKP